MRQGPRPRFGVRRGERLFMCRGRVARFWYAVENEEGPHKLHNFGQPGLRRVADLGQDLSRCELFV